jgi:hypothetical protein
MREEGQGIFEGRSGIDCKMSRNHKYQSCFEGFGKCESYPNVIGINGKRKVFRTPSTPF